MMVRAFICLLLLLPALHAQTLAAENTDNSKHMIVVGGNSAHPPYEFIDRDGKPAGFIVELTKAIAETMDVEVTFKLEKSWSTIFRDVETGRIDVIEGLPFSEERAHILDLSSPHSAISHSIFARTDASPVSSLDDLRGKKVVLVSLDGKHDYSRAAWSQIQIVTVSSIAEAVKMLASAKHDYAVLETLQATYLITDLKITNVELVAKNIDTSKYCFAFRKGNLATLEKFNEGLAFLKETGRYQELQEKWLGNVDTEYASWKWLKKYNMYIVSALIFGLLASIIWSRLLKMRVAARTAALNREVEERKRMDEELRLQHQRLIQADKMAALGVLVSSVAHEINNPNGLLLFNLPLVSEVIKDADPILDAYYREHGEFLMGGLPYSRMRKELPQLLDEMQVAVKRIKRIVDDLKHFSRKNDSNSKELFDVNNVVRTSVRLLEHSLKSSAIHCAVYCTEPLPLIKGNPHRLEQVIVNLVLNAAQAVESANRQKPERTPQPSVDIMSSFPGLPFVDKGIFVMTSYEREVGTIIIRVHDDGIGIPPEHLNRVTDPFFTTKRDSGGTGLGLAISAGIVKEHGGTLSFNSKPGEGATVIIKLPVAEWEVQA